MFHSSIKRTLSLAAVTVLVVIGGGARNEAHAILTA
jgi:hypothetical protein